jgi:hypothetical protein
MEWELHRPWLVVPTLGDRDKTLIPLLQQAEMDSIVIFTNPSPEVDVDHYYREVDTVKTVLREPVAVNIQLWWNIGIDYAVKHGANSIVICNDDVRAARGALLELSFHANSSMRTVLAWPENAGHASIRCSPITGYCFALDPACLHPDSSFKWYWGEHDLEFRARQTYGDDAVTAVSGLDIEHLRYDCSYARAVSHLVDQDRELFIQRYPGVSPRA